MGIINATPDSFFNESRKTNNDEILNQIEHFVKHNVDIIDIGGYSSRPGAKEVSEKEELSRVCGAISEIRKTYPSLLISIDTFRSNVANEALLAGANIINDISGGVQDSEIYKIAANHSAPYIMMHMRGTPANMQSKCDYDNLMKELIYFFSKQVRIAQDAGVNDIFIDPGLGFSKTLDQNYEIVSKLNLLHCLERPLLIGASRKSMLYKLLNTDANNALNATSIINTIALINGANILRVHDVKEANEARIIYQKIKSEY